MIGWQRAALMTAALALAGGLHAEPQARSATLGISAPQHLFVYYPQTGVYYAPVRNRWFWREQGRWQDRTQLPLRYADELDGGIRLRLDAAHPRLRHEVVRRHYAGLQ